MYIGPQNFLSERFFSYFSCPNAVPLHQLGNNVLFDLLLRSLCQVNLQPRFREQVGVELFGRIRLDRPVVRGSHEDDFVLASVEVVANDDLMSVPRQRGTSLRDK